VRYFVVCSPDLPDLAPYVVAEVVRDVPVDEDRRISLAAALAGERAVIATRAELLGDPRGRAALDAWEARDDTEFERETLALSEGWDAGAAVSYLRVVRDGEPEERAKRDLGLPSDARRRDAVLRSQALRAAARRLVARAREQYIDNRHLTEPTIVREGKWGSHG
jgi:hypothetical protein